jgi:hypothetical protein
MRLRDSDRRNAFAKKVRRHNPLSQTGSAQRVHFLDGSTGALCAEPLQLLANRFVRLSAIIRHPEQWAVDASRNYASRVVGRLEGGLDRPGGMVGHATVEEL